MMVVFFLVRVEFWIENFLFDDFCLCSRLGLNMVVKFRDVILFLVIYRSIEYKDCCYFCFLKCWVFNN